MKHIIESEIVEDLHSHNLNLKVRKLIKEYQSQGLVVEIQYSTVNYGTHHQVLYSAYVIGRLKGVN